MAQENGNIDDIIEQIVCTSLLGDKEYQNTEDKSKRRFLYDQQTEMVNESIDQMCKLIESKLPNDVSLPIGLRVEVANQMLVEVTQNPAAVTTGFKIDEKNVMKNLDLPIKSEEKEETSEYQYQDVKATEPENIELSEMLETMDGMINDIQNDIMTQAWGENGTQEDKNAIVAASELCYMEQMLLYGVSFDELEDTEKGFILSALKILKDKGYSERVKVFQNTFDIKDEMLEAEEVDEYGFVDNAENKEEDIRDAKIREGAMAITAYQKYGDRNPSKTDEMYKNIVKMIDNMEYSIDSLLVALREVGEDEKIHRPEENNPRFYQMLEILNNKLRDEESQVECDSYTLADVISIVNILREKDPGKAKYLLEGFNIRLKQQNFEEIKYESIERLATEKEIYYDQYKINTVGIAVNYEKYSGSNGFSKFISDINSASIEREINEVEDDQRWLPKTRKATEEEKNDHKKSIKRDLLEMKEKCGLMMALKLGYENISDLERTKESRATWLEVMENQFGFGNIKSGESIISINDIGILEKHLKEIVEIEAEKAENGNSKSNELQQKYILNLNDNLKIIREFKDKQFLHVQGGITGELIENFSKEMNIFDLNSVNNRNMKAAEKYIQYKSQMTNFRNSEENTEKKQEDDGMEPGD